MENLIGQTQRALVDECMFWQGRALDAWRRSIETTEKYTTTLRDATTNQVVDQTNQQIGRVFDWMRHAADFSERQGNLFGETFGPKSTH